ncbi:hypothetical protein, partial [Photobacterium sanguinicancri]
MLFKAGMTCLTQQNQTNDNRWKKSAVSCGAKEAQPWVPSLHTAITPYTEELDTFLLCCEVSHQILSEAN